MFFSRKKTKRPEQLIEEQRLNEFKTCVKSLMNGIHKLDSTVQDILKVGDVTHDATLFILRSTQDLLSICTMYKFTKYFHVYMSNPMTDVMETLRQLAYGLEEKARKMNMVRENRAMTDRQVQAGISGEIVDEETADDVRRKLYEMSLVIQEFMFEIRTDYRDYREALMKLRSYVSSDYIAIISGIDIPLLYEHNETLVNNHMEQEILFDIDTIKMKFSKEDLIHERHSGTGDGVSESL
jgi:hypothetical protein